MPSSTPQIDTDRLRASLDRLWKIYREMGEVANEVSRWRCPYKNAQDLCTANFGCRNQLRTGTSGPLPNCTGSDNLDYRSAWEA